MAAMPSTPEDFARAWGADTLVRLPAKEGAAPIPTDAYEFLVQAGLPSRVIYHTFVHGSELTFDRLASGLSPVLAVKDRHPQLHMPSSWSAYWLIGDEFYVQGHSLWCMDQNTGHILSIDLDLDEPVNLVNTDVRRFASALLAAVRWTERCVYVAKGWTQQVDQLRKELTALDPDAMKPERGFWQNWLAVIRDEKPRPKEPGMSGFRKAGPKDKRFFDENEPSHRMR